MADAAKLKEFLIALGFQVDVASERKFNQAIAAATTQVVTLGASVTAAAAVIVAGVAKIADQFESLYYTSQRTKASVENIRSFSFAAAQLGSTAEAARSSLENLGRILRTMPGSAGIIKALGVDPTQDLAKVMEQLGERFRNMPYHQANAFAQRLGIDERTLDAMIAGTAKFSAEYSHMLRQAGIDSEQAARSSRTFMQELRTAGAALDILGQKVGIVLSDRLAGGIRTFRQTLVANFDNITRVLSSILNGFLAAADIALRMFVRVADLIRDLVEGFGKLDPRLQSAIKALGGLATAWLVLNSAFLASPIGRIIALSGALVALWDDYKTWREGGESAINWEKWEPQLKAAAEWLGKIGAAFKDLTGLTLGWELALGSLAAYVAGSWLVRISKPILAVLGMLAMIPGSGVSSAAVAALASSAGIAMAGVGAAAAAGAVGMATEGGGLNPLNSLPNIWAMNKIGEALGGAWRWLRGNRGGAAGGGAGGGSSPQGGGTSPITGEIPAEGRGLLATISGPESGGKYNVRYGGATFDDMSRHPNIPEVIRSGPNAGRTSTAAGRYQFLKGTWDEAAAALGLRDFSPASQDKAAWWLASREYRRKTGRELLTDLRSNDPSVRAGIGQVLSGQWTSMPGGIEQGINSGNFARSLDRNIGAETARVQGGNVGTGPITNNNTINVNGSVDNATAADIISQLDRSNQDIVRNMRSSFQ